MIHAALLLTTCTLMAAPPHPLNDAIGGNRKRAPSVVEGNILGSRAFARMVNAAVGYATGEGAGLPGTFGQKVRLSLAGQFGMIEEVAPFEFQDLADGGERSPFLAEHPLDEVIGDEPPSATAVLRSLQRSREFSNILRAAARRAEPLQRGLAGLNFAEQVRMDVSEQIRQADYEP